MKRVIYIAIAVFALGMVSCSKQDVQPNTADPVVPVWEKANDDENQPDPGDPGNDGGITDPNEDPEFSNTLN